MTRNNLGLLVLGGALALPSLAAAGMPRVIEAEFTTLDLSAEAQAGQVASPQGQAVATPEILHRVDHGYLNRHLGSNLQDSNDTLRALLAHDPKNTDLLWRMARGLHAVGMKQQGRDEKLDTFGQGETLLNTALTQSPNDAECHYWLARIYADQNEIKRTLGLAKAMKRELETAIRLDPNHADAHHYLGELLRQLPGIFGGDKWKAVSEGEEAVRLQPNEASHYPALAEAYLNVKDKTRAIEAAKKTFTIKNSDDPGDYEGSLKDARELLQKLGAN